MRDFQFLISDERYSVPTLTIIQAGDVEAARTHAMRLLHEPNHYAVEVWVDDVCILQMTRGDESKREKPLRRGA